MNNPSDEQKQPEDQRVTREIDERHFILYASGTRVTENFFDVRIAFGEAQRNPDGSVRFTDKMTVVFSPQHAKVFLKVFADKVKSYEDKYGKIMVPDELLPTLTSKNPKDAETQIQ